jgi:integrase/recombinase XerC
MIGKGGSMDKALTTRKTVALEPQDVFRLWCERKSPRTVEAYRAAFEHFRRHLGVETRAAALDALIRDGSPGAYAVATEYVGAMARKKIAPATINLRLAALRSLVKVARRSLAVNVTLDIENVRREKRRDTSGPPLADVVVVLEGLRRSRQARDVRDYAALMILWTMGLRRAELLSLETGNLDGATLHVLRKGKTQRVPMEMPPDTEKAVKRWLRKRGDAPGRIFPLTASGLWKMVKARGLKRPHAIRHTVSTECMDEADRTGESRATVADLTGNTVAVLESHYRDERKRDNQRRWSRHLAKLARTA